MYRSAVILVCLFFSCCDCIRIKRVSKMDFAEQVKNDFDIYESAPTCIGGVDRDTFFKHVYPQLSKIEHFSALPKDYSISKLSPKALDYFWKVSRCHAIETGYLGLFKLKYLNPKYIGKVMPAQLNCVIEDYHLLNIINIYPVENHFGNIRVGYDVGNRMLVIYDTKEKLQKVLRLLKEVDIPQSKKLEPKE